MEVTIDQIAYTEKHMTQISKKEEKEQMIGG